MDAATAARMSDPTFNKHFRRRWADGCAPAARTTIACAPPATKTLEGLGQALLHEWRAARIKEDAR